MCCLDIWWNQEGLEWPHCRFPSPLCFHGYGPLAKQPSLSGGPGKVPAYTWKWVSFPCQTAKFKQVNHILPKEPEVTSWYYLPASVLACLFCSQVKPPRGPAWLAVPSSPWAVSMWLINCCLSHQFSVRCRVSGHSHNPAGESLPCQVGELEVIKQIVMSSTNKDSFTSSSSICMLYWGLFYVPECGLSWWMFHWHVKRMYILLLLGGVFFKYQLGLVGWRYCLLLLYPWWFSL